MQATGAAAAGLAEPGSAELERVFEQLRPQLTGYCYRMTGSAFEADDAVQETMLRAWRSFDRFEGRAALSSCCTGRAAPAVRVMRVAGGSGRRGGGR